MFFGVSTEVNIKLQLLNQCSNDPDMALLDHGKIELGLFSKFERKLWTDDNWFAWLDVAVDADTLDKTVFGGFTIGRANVLNRWKSLKTVTSVPNRLVTQHD